MKRDNRWRRNVATVTPEERARAFYESVVDGVCARAEAVLAPAPRPKAAAATARGRIAAPWADAEVIFNITVRNQCAFLFFQMKITFDSRLFQRLDILN